MSDLPDPVPPRAERANVMLMATIERSGVPATRHRVRDVSPGGIRIDGAGDLPAGERLSVSVGALRAIEATVRWSRAGCAGLAFLSRIDPDDTRKKADAPVRTPLARAAVPAAGWIDDLRDPYRR